MSKQHKPAGITFTPGDITDELIEMASDQARANVGHGEIVPVEIVAASVLNAAVTLGLVIRNEPQPFSDLEIEFIRGMSELRRQQEGGK